MSTIDNTSSISPESPILKGVVEKEKLHFIDNKGNVIAKIAIKSLQAEKSSEPASLQHNWIQLKVQQETIWVDKTSLAKRLNLTTEAINEAADKGDLEKLIHGALQKRGDEVQSKAEKMESAKLRLSPEEARAVAAKIERSKDKWFAKVGEIGDFVDRSFTIGEKKIEVIVSPEKEIHLFPWKKPEKAPREEYQVFLGKGGDKLVYQSYVYAGEKKMALGDVTIKDEEKEGRIDREIGFINKFKGKEGILQYHGVVNYSQKEPEALSQKGMLMEYCSLGNLIGLLEPEGMWSKLTTLQRIDVFKQIAVALATLHEGHVVHRDLKPENILCKEGTDGKLIVKISDFGYACEDSETEALKRMIGTPQYFSPERIYEGIVGLDEDPIVKLPGESKVGPAADLWALGCMIVECLLGVETLPWNLYVETAFNSLTPAVDDTEKISPAEEAAEPAENEFVYFLITTLIEMQRPMGAIVDSLVYDPDQYPLHAEVELLKPVIDQLLQIDPAKRGTATDIANKLNTIYEKKLAVKEG